MTPTYSSLPANADSRFLRVLAERIRKGSCVLVLGEDISFESGNSTRLVTDSLVDLLSKELESAGGKLSLDTNNARHVAELYYQYVHDRDYLAIPVQDFYRKYSGETNEIYKTLANLPFRLCVSTTHDDFYYNALKQFTKKIPCKTHYNFKRTHNVTLPEPTIESPLIYHLFGHPADLDSLVLNESDLIEFLVKVIQGSPPLPDRIRGIMGDPDTSFLFMGFGFQHWSVRVILHVLKVYGHKSKSIALEKNDFFSSPDFGQIITFFSGDHAIEFKKTQWQEFTSDLKKIYESISSKTDVTQPHLPSDSPKVFICYANEDIDKIENLSNKLLTAEIDVWRDKQNLRGGDKWDRLLMHVIENKVNYVLVAQSKAMVGQSKGYFYKEIKSALATMDKMKEGIKFVIPAKIDDCDSLTELRDLHEIDISTDDGFKKLVSEIQNDWKLRKSELLVEC